MSSPPSWRAAASIAASASAGEIRVERGYLQALAVQIPGRRRVPARVPGHDHDVGAGLGQGGGKRLAQSLISPGDHRLAAIQRETFQYPHTSS